MRKSIKIGRFLMLCLVVGMVSCKVSHDTVYEKQRVEQLIKVASPDHQISITFDNLDSKPSYSISHKGRPIIDKSAMGFVFKTMQRLDSNLMITNVKTAIVDQTWEQPWGQKRVVRDNHHSLLIELQEKSELRRELQIEFKVFNDGVGFRYIFPRQRGIDSIYIMDELTEFSFTNNHKAWNIPAYDKRNYEILYEKSPINTLGYTHTPLTIETTDGLFLSIHEASLTDYASMTLYCNGPNTLKCDLTPWKDKTKVKTNHSFRTPWRTIQIAQKPGDLIESDLILNLNEPNVLGDVSWVHPMKYIGIWWGIHINKWSFHQGPNLGATTENTIQYIDFAAKEGFDEVLVEGWNEGFEAEWYKDFGPRQNFTKPNPRFDLIKLQAYAKSKGVTLQAYNETCSNSENYLSQIDSAFSLYRKLGYHSVKVGQVNVGASSSTFENGELHYGQYGVNYYQTVLEKAAKYQLSINFHEPVRPSGLHRTYPNLISQEGARGQEYNAWSPDGGNKPEHLTILPFTRLLGGPMDFTPGIFRIDIPQMSNNRVNTTLAKQLAAYVIVYSPIQMAADLIENYEDHPAFQFIKDVPTNWETTKVIDAKIADYVILVRKDVDTEDWYLGALTDEEKRDFSIKLDFLDVGHYEAQIYQDSEKTDLELAPMEYEILTKSVDRNSVLNLELANSGGAAIRFKRMK